MDTKNKNRQTPCKITKRISLLIDNELSEKDEDSVRRHMAVCGVCRKEYEALISVNRLLREQTPLEPSDDFARNFWKKADAIEAKKARWRVLTPLASWGWQSSLVSAAATALIIIAAGTVYFRQASYHNQPINPTAIPVDMRVAEDMPLYENYEIIENLDLFEHWDEINSIKEI